MKKIILLILFTISILTPINIFAQAEIVGGEDADIEDYPYQVALGSSSNWGGGSGFFAYCGASGATRTTTASILTTGHIIRGCLCFTTLFVFRMCFKGVGRFITLAL